MKNRKYWKLYQCLSSEEKKQAGRWLKAELDGKQEDVLAMYNVLGQTESDTEVWQQIYPNQPYNDGKLRLIGFQLSEKLSDFISWQTFKQDDFMRDLYLLKGLNRRDSSDLLPKSVKRIRKDFESKTRRDSKYYRAIFELESEYLHYLIKTSDKELKKVQCRIIDVFLSACFQEIIHRGIANLNGPNRELPLFTEMVDWLLEQSLPHDAVFIFYQKLLKLLKNRSENTSKLIAQLQENPKRFGDKDEIVSICIMIINILTSQYHKNQKKEALKKLYDFYQWAINEKWIFMGPYLSRNHYLNILVLATKMKSTSQIQYCMREFAPLLPDKIQYELRVLSEASLCFIRGEYTRITPLLNLKFSRSMDEIRARFFSLQARYELGEREDLRPDFQYLAAIIQRDRQIKANRKPYLKKSVNFFRKLVRAKNREDYLKILEVCPKEQLPLIKDWLVEKCEKALLSM